MTARLATVMFVLLLAAGVAPAAKAQGSVSGDNDDAYIYAQWDKSSVAVGGTVNIYIFAYAKYGAITWTDPYARWWAGSRTDFSINGNANWWATWTFSSGFSGWISFTPQGVGFYDIGFRIYNSSAAETHAISMTVNVYAPTPAITSGSSLTLAQDQSYAYGITASNGPTSYSATGLPPGFSVNSSSGVISGSCATPGSYSSTISASNAYGMGSASLSWTIVAPVISNSPSVTPTSITNGASLTLRPNGSANFGIVWIENSIFPPSGAGINVGNQYGGNANNPISYLPVSGPGTYTYATRVVDNYYHYTDASTTFTVLPPPPAITSPGTLNILFGQSASYQVTATNTPTSFGFSWGAAAPGPAGFTAGGLFTNTPTAAGSYSFTVSAYNAGGSGSLAVSYTVSKTTPTIAFSGQSFSTSITLSATQLNATAANPYGAAVSAPTGTITYAVVGASGANASPTGAIGSGTVLLPGSYTVRASYPGDANYNATSTDVPFTVANTAPHLANLSATPNSIYFGQSASVSATATDADGNLYAHGLLLLTADGSTWLRPPGVDYSRTGWNVFAADTADTWSSLNFSNDTASGSSSTKSAVFTAGAARSYVFHSNGHDGTSWTDNGPTYTLTVNPTTPTAAFPARSYSTGLPLYTWTAGDANATFTNPYSSSVAAPSGTVSYAVVGTGTAVTAGTQFGPGTYSIKASYPGNANYNATSITTTLTFTQLAPVLTSATSAAGTLGGAFSYQITASNNPTAYTATGTLPNGLTFTPASGTIAGTAAIPGTFPVTVTASNAAGTASQTLTITIANTSASSSGTIVFPSTTQGSTAHRTASFTNSGNTLLTVSFLTAYGDQTPSDFATAAAPLTIAAGATADIPVAFSPTSTGAKTGAFVVFNSDSTATPRRYVLQATATSANPPQPPTASIAPDSSTLRVGQTTTIRATYAAGAYDALTDTSLDAPAGTPLAGADGSGQTFRTYTFTPTTTGTFTFYARALTPNFPWAAYASTSVTVSPRQYTLTVTISGPGSAVPLGATTYNANEVATITETPNANATFAGWQGAASGTVPTINLTMTADKAVTAVFSAKAAQTITFVDPGAQVVGLPFALAVSASSGLPVTLSVTSGNAALTGDSSAGYHLTITTAGSVVVTASQPGDATYLAAPDVARTINGVTVTLKVRQDSDRVKVLRGDQSDNPTVIIGRP